MDEPERAGRRDGGRVAEAVADLDTYDWAPCTEADDLRLFPVDFDYQAGRLPTAADGIAG